MVSRVWHIREYVIVDIDVDILGVYQGTIEIENAGTDWGKGGPGSSHLHGLSFVFMISE